MLGWNEKLQPYQPFAGKSSGQQPSFWRLADHFPEEFGSNLHLTLMAPDPTSKGLLKMFFSWSRCGRLWLELDSRGRQMSRTRVGDRPPAVAFQSVSCLGTRGPFERSFAFPFIPGFLSKNKATPESV